MKHESTRGNLLLAVPQMLDPNFMHSVVLVCEHTSEGAFGFVVNQPSSFDLTQLVPDHPDLGGIDFPVYCGGPVGHEALQFVHRLPDEIEGGHEVACGLHLGGSIGSLARVLREDPRARQHVRLFMGHSGWSAGQLEGEIAISSWMRAPMALERVFCEKAAESIWRSAMCALGSDGRGLSHLPPDVSWN
jgi:putative transcriptional regulator